MDAVVCLECRAATRVVTTSLSAPTATLSRSWRECEDCGWESPYWDVVHRMLPPATEDALNEKSQDAVLTSVAAVGSFMTGG